jgi:hypothetical protein
LWGVTGHAAVPDLIVRFDDAVWADMTGAGFPVWRSSRDWPDSHRERLAGELNAAQRRRLLVEIQQRLRRSDSGRAFFLYQFATQVVQSPLDWPAEELVGLFAAVVGEPGQPRFVPGRVRA